jgi:predicted amidohydrolase YtcJ
VFFWGDWHRQSFGEERGSDISATSWARSGGMHFTSHTDAMVMPPNLMRAVEITAYSTTHSGYVLGPDQRLSVMDALKTTTSDGAYQYFEESTKGSITVGRQADLVILGQSPLTTDPAELENIAILEASHRGRSVFKK